MNTQGKIRVVPDERPPLARISRRRLLQLMGAGLVAHGSGLGAIGCTCVSNVPLAPAGTYRTEGDTIVLDLTEIPKLTAVGHAVRVPVDAGEDSASQIIVAHTDVDVFRAFPNRCTHRGKELDYRHEDEELRCCNGKSRFDLDGNVTAGPASQTLAALPLRREGDDLIIDLPAKLVHLNQRKPIERLSWMLRIFGRLGFASLFCLCTAIASCKNHKTADGCPFGEAPCDIGCCRICRTSSDCADPCSPENLGGYACLNRICVRGCDCLTTCVAEGANCGTVTDGCGGTLFCGTCAVPLTCGGGGKRNACGCTPEPGLGILPARVRVDVSQDLGPVNRLVIGSNMLAYGRHSNCGSGVWDPVAMRSVPEMVMLAQEEGIAVSRWPGGCGVHGFDWKNAVGPLDSRPNQQFGLPEFLRNSADIGAMPVITLSAFVGTAQDAADLVEYCNAEDDGTHPWAALRATDGHPEPWNVVWFEYGNETYHGDHAGALMTPTAYAESYLLHRQAMRDVDPQIKLGAVLVNSTASEVARFETRWTASWNAVVLGRLGGDMDFAIHHAYLPRYHKDVDTLSDTEVHGLFAAALAIGHQWEEHYREMNTLIRAMTGRDDIPLAITEYNGHFVQERPTPYRLSLGNALVNAEIIRVLMQPRHNIGFANQWHFVNDYWGAVRNQDNPLGTCPWSGPYVRRPNHFVFQLYTEHFGDVLVPASVDCESYDTPGGYEVEPAFGEHRPTEIFPDNLLPDQTWTIRDLIGVQQSESDGVLTVDFVVPQDVNYFHASKLLPASSDTWYRLTAVVRAEDLQNDQGQYDGGSIQIGDGRGYTVTQSCAITQPVVDTTDWVTVSVDYRTLPDTENIVLLARRVGGDDRGAIRGRFAVREMRVQRILPGNLGATPVLSVNASRSHDGNRTFLMLLNKNLVHAQEVLIEGVPARGARAWTLSGPSVDATNENQPDNVGIEETCAALAGETVLLTLAPHSLTAVEISLNR